MREEFGFRRTVCGCAACAVGCRRRPGCLVPADLGRLCAPGRDVFAWAEEHLRARVGEGYPLLVPARRGDGACHWLLDGKCLVHADAPYGCAFFDAHMAAAEVERRYAAAAEALRSDDGLYRRVWLHLASRGLIAPRVGGAELDAECARLRRAARRGLRRVSGDHDPAALPTAVARPAPQ